MRAHSSLAWWSRDTHTSPAEAGFPLSRDPEVSGTRHGLVGPPCEPPGITSHILAVTGSPEAAPVQGWGSDAPSGWGSVKSTLQKVACGRSYGCSLFGKYTHERHGTPAWDFRTGEAE